MIQSYIGNVPKGSIFAFLTSNGAGGFARRAMRMAGMWLILAVLLAAVGQLLWDMDNGKYSADVAKALESAWNRSTGQDQGGSSSAGHTMPVVWVGVAVAVVCAWFQL